MRPAAAALALGFLLSAGAGAQEGPVDPPRFHLSGETRARYEVLDNQFRAGGGGGDQLLLFRTLVLGELSTGPAVFGLELQDSRAYLGDSGTAYGSSSVDPLDVLQAYARLEAGDFPSPGWATDLTLGRQTVGIGSERQIERPGFANVLRSYTGVHAVARTAAGHHVHALLVVPVGRLPADRRGRADNELVANEEEWHRLIWGLHARRAELPAAAADLSGEAYVYGLLEDDEPDAPTPNRRYVTPGVRLERPPAPGRWDLDLEAALRFGSRRASAAADDLDDLDVRASMLFLTVGFTAEAPWRPRVALQYYWASGDEDPDDSEYGRYERLFGSRSSDLNHTSIYGPLTPANLNAPGLRVEVEPTPRTDARLSWYAAHLASETDAWVVARVRDPSGRSGDLIGHALDGRARLHALGGALVLEVGGSALLYGSFARNAPGGPEGERTLYGYTQVTLGF